MKKRRFLSIVMAVLMVMTLLPSMVFAAEAPAGKLDGKLGIKGTAAVGSTLSADLSKAKPKGITEEYVNFQWSRKAGEELTEVGTQKSYQVTGEDAGCKLVLTVTGIEDKGVTGSLSVATEAVPQSSGGSETPDENSGYEEEMPQEEENYQEPESLPAEDQQPEEEDLDAAQLGLEETEEEAPKQESLTYGAEVYTEDGSGLIDFATLDYGYQDSETAYATVKNTGTGILNFEGISPESFMAMDIEEPLQPGEEATVWVQPRTGLEPGTYRETITYNTDEGVSCSFEATVTVSDPVNEPAGEDPDMQPMDEPGPSGEPDTSNGLNVPEDPDALLNQGDNDAEPAVENVEITASPESLVFDPLTEGYAQITGKEVVIKNTGTAQVTLTVPAAEHFDVAAKAAEGQQADSIVLDSQQEAVFTVSPKAGLLKGSYKDTMDFGIKDNEIVKAQVTAEVEVTDAVQIPVKAEPSTLTFDNVKEGYAEAPAAQTVTLTNEQSDKITIQQPQSENFVIGALSVAELPGGGNATFTVQPKTGLKAGEYKEVINIYPEIAAGNEEAGTAPVVQPIASVTAQLTVENGDPVYKLTVNPDSLDFGEKEAGYKEAPKAQKVTVTNEGNTSVELEQPDSEYFEVGALSAVVLNPGESASFNVRPKTGLEESDYLEVLDIGNSAQFQALVNCYFSVTDSSNKLTSIQKPADITGLKNGVEKSAKGLKLPSTVVIKTTDGKLKANVKWDVKGCAYDRQSTDKQTFNVKGTVTLPKGVTNPDDISLVTAVKVTVGGYSPKVPDASENKITGISSDGGYTTQSKITFTAVGAGMDNTSPRKGDVRYVPLNWTVINTNSWQDAPYTGAFGLVKSGNYTLSVVFNRQKFDGSNWVNTGEQDTKKVNFSVGEPKNVTGQNLTPAANRSDANKKAAVKTGDTTNIMPFVVILIIAAGCVVGVVVYRKKRK
ncbi:MAG: hypothetical protein Q4D16_16765 [Eubacteriales bacterium]|nr:hypothetical protein [Eubacteriales bacterium]